MTKRRQPGRRSGASPADRRGSNHDATATTLRIVGGQLGGRKLHYSGDSRVRPMKDRTREAVFNLLGPIDTRTFVFDLFAGTGAMAIEAISRGAARGICIEQHVPTAKLIAQNLVELGVDGDIELLMTNALRWTRLNQSWPQAPWLVFVCPPYRFFSERTSDMLQLIETFCRHAPDGSHLVVEADGSFDLEQLPEPQAWRTRTYPPAVIAIRSFGASRD